MANEINLSVNLLVQNGTYRNQFQAQGQQITQSALGADAGILSVTTSPTNLPVGSVSTLGVCVLQNCDLTNFITAGITSGSYAPILKLKPGETIVVRLNPGITFQLQADTATCLVNYLLLGD